MSVATILYGSQEVSFRLVSVSLGLQKVTPLRPEQHASRTHFGLCIYETRDAFTCQQLGNGSVWTTSCWTALLPRSTAKASLTRPLKPAVVSTLLATRCPVGVSYEHVFPRRCRWQRNMLPNHLSQEVQVVVAGGTLYCCRIVGIPRQSGPVHPWRVSQRFRSRLRLFPPCSMRDAARHAYNARNGS